ncbi:MAG: hypothetical protein AB7F36_12460 [Reyranellaceae bacterium]
MLGDLMRLGAAEVAVHARGWLSGAAATVIAAVFAAVAIGFATVALYAGLVPELGDAWTAALLAGVYALLALIAVVVNAALKRRRQWRKAALANARAAAVPSLSPEMMLVAAAAGALLSLTGRSRR